MKQLTTTGELREELVLRAYRKGYGYAKLVVFRVTPFFYLTDSPAEFFQSVETGDKLLGYLWTQNSVSFEFGMDVAGKICVPIEGEDTDAVNRLFLAFAHTTDISSSLERRCLRASVSIPFSFFIINVARSERSFYTEEIQHLDGVITVLSDREAVFETGVQLDPSTLIRGRLTIEKNDIDITARIVDARQGKPNRYEMEYTGMSDRERNTILEYVFTIYRE